MNGWLPTLMAISFLLGLIVASAVWINAIEEWKRKHRR